MTTRLGGHWGHVGLVFAVALALRLVVAWSSVRVPTADDTGFRDTAWAIAIGEGHVLGSRVTFKAPLYPAAIAAVYLLNGRDDRAVRTVQAIVGASVCVLVFWFGILALGAPAALLGAWILAVHPIFLALTDRLLAENLFIWLVAAALGVTAWLFEAPSSRKAVLLGIICGLVSLTRSIGVGLAVVLAALFIFHRWKQGPTRPLLGQAALILVACAVVIAPWTIRNGIRLHAFVPVSTEMGRNLYSGWVSVPEEKRFGFTAVDANTRHADTLSEVASDRYLLEKAVEHLRTHPEVIPRYLFLKSLYFWSPIDWDVVGYGEGTYNGVYGAVVPFMLLGIWEARNRAPVAFRVCLPVVIYFWCIALVGTTTPRYRYPVEPALLLLAGLGVVTFFRNATSRAVRAALATSWVLCNLIAIVFSNEAKVALRTALIHLGVW